METVEASGSVTNSFFTSPSLQNKVLNIDAVKVKLQVRAEVRDSAAMGAKFVMEKKKPPITVRVRV